MNEAILLSIRPEHALNILKGNKTLELRKRVPKNFKGWVYVYVTKGKRLSVVHDDENGKTYYYTNSNWGRSLNQDIPFRFWFDEYEEITPNFDYEIYEKEINNILPELCISLYHFEEYVGDKDKVYLWHIKNLEILDEPMELSEFCTWNKGDKWTPDMNWLTLKRAPQSWQYVYVKE